MGVKLPTLLVLRSWPDISVLESVMVACHNQAFVASPIKVMEYHATRLLCLTSAI
jgi:hypothetical protein